eukprot:11199972-Lingulodinium_polyedra.AAC.1
MALSGTTAPRGRTTPGNTRAANCPERRHGAHPTAANRRPTRPSGVAPKAGPRACCQRPK